MTHPLIHLTRGVTYLAATAHGTVRGEYLGAETPYGDPAILLRSEDGVESIAVDALHSISREI